SSAATMGGGPRRAAEGRKRGDGIVRASLNPDHVEEALSRLLRSEVSCVRAGDGLYVDTPYVLQDGHLLRVYLDRAEDRDGIVASDGGSATSQIETFACSNVALRERYAQLERIAQQLDLGWDTEFRFTAPDLDEALRRLAVLARAVDQSLSLIQARRSRAPF